MSTTTLNRPENNILTNIFMIVLFSPFLLLKYILGVLISNWRVSLRLFLTVSFFATVSLFSFFVYQINAEISERYLSKKYSTEYEKLLEEKQGLEMNLIGANSLNNADSLMEKLSFEKVEKVSYIKVLSGQVVKK